MKLNLCDHFVGCNVLDFVSLYHKIKQQMLESQNTTNYIFIRLVVCLTTGPKPLPKRALHIVRSRASSFK